MNYILGIDVGTSNVKAVLFDTCGTEIFTASRESKVISSGVTAEQDMLALWELVRDCIGRVAKRPEAKLLRAIGVTGQGEGCWLLDANAMPIQNAILWCDGRAAAEVNAIKESETGAMYHRTTGSPPLTGSSMMLLKWMQNHRKDVLDRARYAVNCKDWIRSCLTGTVAGELTDSFMSFIDHRTNLPALALMDALGLSDYQPIVPAPLPSDTVAGTLKDDLATQWGLPLGLPVVAGAVDTAATALGLGAVHQQDTCVILGTTCACETILSLEDCRFGAPDTRYEKHPLPGLYVALQPTMNGTPNIDWMLDHLASTRDFNEIDRIVDAIPVGSGGVIYHPYISAAGERAPFYHPYASAGFFGLNQNVTNAHLIRAVYEGISLSIRDCLSVSGSSKMLYLAGGGANSPVWAQMIADVTGMTVTVSGGKEFGAKGAALLAATAVGIYADYGEAVSQACKAAKVYTPDPIRVKQYDLIYSLYRQIRLQHMGLWDHRHSVMAAVSQLKQ